MNPNLFSTRFARPERPADVDALWAHYAWMQGLGVRWFNVSLDDVGKGIDPGNHVEAGLQALKGLITERTQFLIANHMLAHDYRSGKLGRVRHVSGRI